MTTRCSYLHSATAAEVHKQHAQYQAMCVSCMHAAYLKYLLSLLLLPLITTTPTCSYAQVKGGLNNMEKDKGLGMNPFDACKIIVCGAKTSSLADR
jgi:hypothetical protein